jgi:gliding motility-associated-like protein
MLIFLRKLPVRFRSQYSTSLFILVVAWGISNSTIAQDRYNFNYSDRNSLLSDGWDFIAVTPSGTSRNTEQTTGAIISYDQLSHPGVIRIPADVGELLGSANNSRNTIFRNLPARWTSVRIKITSFSPSQNYQQAGFAIYQDDNNYLQFTRRYDGNNCIKVIKETSGTYSNVNTITLSTTSNLYLRLDRDPATDIIIAYYSLDGTYWNIVANTTMAFNNPRLAIVTGASPSGFPNADFAWAEVSYQAPLSGDELFTNPHSVVFNAVQGQALSDIKSIFLSSALGGILDWSFGTDVSWLTPDSQSGVTDDVLKVSVNTAGIGSGIHYGNIILESPQSTTNPVIIPVTLIVNPAVPVSITTWKDGRDGAMSVSVDDSQGSGFDALQANGFKGTYVLQGVTPPSFYTTYYNAGMELGSHTVHHLCETVTNSVLRSQELEPNISALCTKTPEPCKDVITLVWPCGYTNYREQAIACDYFLNGRGYNINKLEDATPENFMNLKSYNSHLHTPYPPSDLKTVVDLAVQQHKWFNLVLHDLTNDDGAITYASSKSIWVASIGTVVKYILQRERFILTNYNESVANITYSVSRLAIPSSSLKNFEQAFGSNDSTTMQIDFDDSKTIENVYVGGIVNHYQIKSVNGNLVVLTNVRLDPSTTKAVEVRYVNNGATNLTISGITANNKVYDRTTAATLNLGSATLSGVIAGDDVTLVTTGATGTFSDKSVGTSKIVSCSGFTISGADASKYYLTQPILTANISAVTLTISGVSANNKVYDRTTSATLNSGSAVLSGVLSGDNVTLIKTSATGTFASKNVGTAKIVSTSGFTLGSSDAANYILIQPSTTANITPATLAVSGVTANNKVYDGTTTAIINTGGATLTGIIGSDVVALGTSGVTGTFENANVGAGKLVTISGFTISGTDSGNYTLVQPTTTANITGYPLTVTGVTANSRVYNGTTAATLNTGNAALSGVLAGDVVNLVSTGATGVFANKNAGSNKTVIISGFTLTGADAAKYTLTQPSATASITVASLTVSGVVANNKTYDGKTTATLNNSAAVLSGVFGTDVVSLVSTSATGTFENKNVGTSKIVSISGFTLGSTDAANYILTQPSASADITPATLTVSGVTANNKVYDGTTTASLNTGSAILTGILGTDVVVLGTSGVTGTFENANVGMGKSVIISGFTASGTDSGNYKLVQPTTTASITGLPLTITGVTANNKVYNGTTAATLNTGNAALSGVLAGDAVTLVSAGAKGLFANKNAGTNKTVIITGFTLTGTDAGKYALTQPSATASITVANLTVSGVVANNKTYDGLTSATLNSSAAVLSGVFGTDVVSLVSTSATGTFADRNAGTAKTVTTSGFTLAGTDAANYLLTQPSAKGNIIPANLTVSGVTANNKVYDGLTAAVVEIVSAKLEGVLGNDVVILVSTAVKGSFANKNAGTAKTVLLTGFTLSGSDAANYNLTQPSASASITPTTLTVSGVKANNKVYNGNTAAILNTAGATPVGVIGSDIVSLNFSGASGTFANKNIGTGKSVSISGIKLGGTDAGNYTPIQPATTADITAATITVSGLTANDKVYDGTTTAVINTGNISLAGIFSPDAVTLNTSSVKCAFENKNVGSSKTITVSGLSIEGSDAYNYKLMQPSLIADITPKSLTIHADNINKGYGFSLTFTGTEYTTDGLIEGDLITGVTLSSPGANASAIMGTYDIIISGGSNSNYSISYVRGKLTVGKAILIVTADDKTKTYGSENPELSITYSGFIKGDDASTLDVPPVASTDAETDSDAGNYEIDVSGGADSKYSFTYQKGTLYINKADQVITFGQIPHDLRMTQEFKLEAEATSGLPVTYVCSDPNKVSINGDVLTVLEDGNMTITAQQEGNHNWNPANNVTQSIETLPTFDNISSLFTPNNDGMNDFWYIPDLEQYGKIQVNVYNRFGQLVYKSDSYKNDWDGTWNGNPLPSAAYYYIIKSSLKGFIKGVVNIVR